jgi:hypothetical protein
MTKKSAKHQACRIQFLPVLNTLDSTPLGIELICPDLNHLSGEATKQLTELGPDKQRKWEKRLLKHTLSTANHLLEQSQHKGFIFIPITPTCLKNNEETLKKWIIEDIKTNKKRSALVFILHNRFPGNEIPDFVQADLLLKKHT